MSQRIDGRQSAPLIVELSSFDLLNLTNDKPITVGDIIVRTTTDATSNIIGAMVEEKPAKPYRADTKPKTRRRSNRTGGHFIVARFDSCCCGYSCDRALKKGDLIVYDYDESAAYCLGHGQERFPNLDLDAYRQRTNA
jgi:hypothetical protein